MIEKKLINIFCKNPGIVEYKKHLDNSIISTKEAPLQSPCVFNSYINILHRVLCWLNHLKFKIENYSFLIFVKTMQGTLENKKNLDLRKQGQHYRYRRSPHCSLRASWPLTYNSLTEPPANGSRTFHRSISSCNSSNGDKGQPPSARVT